MALIKYKSSKIKAAHTQYSPNKMDLLNQVPLSIKEAFYFTWNPHAKKDLFALIL